MRSDAGGGGGAQRQVLTDENGDNGNELHPLCDAPCLVQVVEARKFHVTSVPDLFSYAMLTLNRSKLRFGCSSIFCSLCCST